MTRAPYPIHRFQLVRHPDFPCDAIQTIEVTAHRIEDAIRARLELTYVLTGSIAKLCIPEEPSGDRVDGLWQHTCCEVFIKGAGDSYGEFNFAPSTAWAAYTFMNYRNGMTNASVPSPRIRVDRDAHRLRVNVELDCSDLPFAKDHWRLALSAVIEEVDGRKSYWALAHRTPPDFHHESAFVSL